MTRVNLGIPVKHLTDEHLLAEHREIKRLCECLDKSIKCGSIKSIPDKFTLGTGHVKFFFNKMNCVYRRYVMIYLECRRRHFNVTDYSENFRCSYRIYPEYFNDYIASEDDNKIVSERISERIDQGKLKLYHYKGKSISKQQEIELLYGKKI
jgi:deoxyribonuclease (pyrimidine dimer)